MVHLLLTILKILGIILLVILGLLLAVILVVLLVPIRYRADVFLEEKKPKGKVRISWLFHILGVHVDFEGSHVAARVRILWLKLLDTGKETTETSDAVDDLELPKETVQIEPKAQAEPRVQAEPEVRIKPEAQAEPEVRIKPEVQAESEVRIKSEVQAEPKKSAKLETQMNPKQSFFERIRKKVLAFFEKIRAMYRQMTGNYEALQQKIRMVREFFENEANQKTIRLVWRQVRRLIKHILPGKMNGRVRFGFDDPAVTGQILTYISPFYGVYAETVSIEPVFDESVLEGELHLKGYIRIGTVLWTVLRVCLNKNFRVLLKKLLKSRR